MILEKKAKLTNVHGSLLVDFLIEQVSEPMESGLIMPNVKQYMQLVNRAWNKVSIFNC